MLQAAQRAWQIGDLRAKILFTLAMLGIYRVIAHIPVPYTDARGIQDLLNNNALLGILNLFSGGALQNFSVAAMGVYPYITASIITQLLTPLIPALEEWSKEGESGRTKINRLQYYITVPLAILQAYGQTLTISRSAPLFEEGFNFNLFSAASFLPTFTIILTMTAGTMILVWMAELIDERGIGNGISMIIFGGIVARLYATVANTASGAAAAQNVFGIAAFVVLTLLTIFVIVIVQEGVRRIPVEYQRRVRGNKVYGGQRTHIPLKVNMAGMIPLIFAQSLMLLPSIIASYFCVLDANNPASQGLGSRIACGILNNLSPNVTTGGSGHFIYAALLFVLVVGFTYFYSVVLFTQQNLPESLKNNGGFIPGIRPGKATEAYLGRVLNRITLAGALFLGTIAVLPYLTSGLTGVANVGISSTALLIVVGVAVDTMRQLESQLMMRNYEGYLGR
jgi:preprotein translocase subunit SecY